MSEWWEWWINDPNLISKQAEDGIFEEDRIRRFIELEQGSKDDQKFDWWFSTKKLDDPVFDDDDPDPNRN